MKIGLMVLVLWVLSACVTGAQKRMSLQQNPLFPAIEQEEPNSLEMDERFLLKSQSSMSFPHQKSGTKRTTL
jgi:hypothetical protein